MAKIDLKTEAKAFNINLDDLQLALYDRYYNEVIDCNQKVNLTAITDEEDFYVKHFLDSLSASELIPKGSFVVDIGSGAGFPAIPLKLARNDLSFTLLDALNKRVDFLKHVVDLLGLSDVECLHLRAEEAAKTGFRGRFDVCIARAVADIRTLLEYAIPLLKVGGRFIAYKGGDSNELALADNALSLLKCKVLDVIRLNLPVSGDSRQLIVIEKTGETPLRYPRGGGKEKKFPL